MRRLLVAASLVASVPAFASGADFTVTCASCQSAFEGVVEDASAALNYKAVGPAEASGVTGFAIDAVGTYVPVKNKDDWKSLTGSDVKAVGMAGITVRKGLPFDFDVGGFYTAIPGASASLYGGELRYAILAGGVATPALAVRASYVRTGGIDDFDYSAWGADVSVSKGFTVFTPYAGVGVLRAIADPGGAPPAAGLSKVKRRGIRAYGGVRIGLGFFDIIPEYEHIGANNVYNLALGVSF
jgi:hypothetical protein